MNLQTLELYIRLVCYGSTLVFTYYLNEWHGFNRNKKQLPIHFRQKTIAQR